MKKLIFASLMLAGLASSCKKDSSTTPYTPSCDGTEKSYTADVKPILQNACINCHSNLSTYSQVYSSRSSIRSVIVSGSMPRGSSLSAAQKDAIVCWIDNGAPEN